LIKPDRAVFQRILKSRVASNAASFKRFRGRGRRPYGVGLVGEGFAVTLLL
jgi:hypothetical protein